MSLFAESIKKIHIENLMSYLFYLDMVPLSTHQEDLRSFLQNEILPYNPQCLKEEASDFNITNNIYYISYILFFNNFYFFFPICKIN